jgi:hypothetical protein
MGNRESSNPHPSIFPLPSSVEGRKRKASKENFSPSPKLGRRG